MEGVFERLSDKEAKRNSHFGSVMWGRGEIRVGVEEGQDASSPEEYFNAKSSPVLLAIQFQDRYLPNWV